MTMHLLGPEYSTTRTCKPKAKLSQTRQKQLKSEWHEHNRWLKQNHMAKISFEEFEDYVCGRSPKKEQNRKSKLKNTQSPHADRMEAYKNIPSHGIKESQGHCSKKESPKYTGTYVKGVATMHKSNAVPVVDDQHAKDLASMRR